MNRPKVLKGGFVHFESDATQEHVITFQYNPETLQRMIAPIDRHIHPKETIKFTLALDASDTLEHGDPTTSSLGIYPALSALELLVQPPRNRGEFLANLWPWITRRDNPLTLFVWGVHRVVPIRVLGLVIREQMFDATLNPIRADIDVTLETLTDADLKSNPRAKTIMDSYLGKKESLARQAGSIGSAEDLLRDVRL